MINEIDKYKLNLYCKCLSCDKFKPNIEGRLPHSCEAYPKTNGIPFKVWNGKNAECTYFKSKHPNK